VAVSGAAGVVWVAIAVMAVCGADGAVAGGWNPNNWAAGRVSGRM
jgi:hypothetical protein